MIRQGWGDENSAFMRAFSSIFLPNGTPEQIRWLADQQRMTTSAAVAARMRQACDDLDVSELLPRVSVPTLVLHARKDGVVPFEQGRQIATGIPGAAFKTLESENHVLLPDEPAWEQQIAELKSFALAYA
jgi:pimeloyl-ACP methyl ester carboxylesterase